jgi:hypothetical protein
MWVALEENGANVSFENVTNHGHILCSCCCGVNTRLLWEQRFIFAFGKSHMMVNVAVVIDA